MTDYNNKQLLYSILKYLNTLKSEANAENIDVASQCISTAFGLRLESVEDFKENSTYPIELPEIFSAGISSLNVKSFSKNLEDLQNDQKYKDYIQAVSKKGYFAGCEENSIEYMQRSAKAISKFKEKFTSTASTSTPALSKAQKESMAEEKKNEGNAAIQRKDYNKAISCYSEAINLVPDGQNSHIYFSNRAAAHCHQNNYTDAVKDCNSSIKLNPSYVKAYSRLGLAHFFLEQYEDAVDAYSKAADLEPNTQAHKDSLRQAKQKLSEREKERSRSVGAPGSAAGGGAPDLGALAGLLGGAGGAGGIGELMKNPAMMQMAQQMMSNPAMMQQAMSMLGGGGGGAGGMPDLSGLASMMGGAGGRPPAGGGIPAFSGFDGEPDPVVSAAPAAAPRGAGAPIFDPEFLDRMRNSDDLRSMQGDPTMQNVIRMMQSGDIQGAMREAQGNPELMQRVMGAFSKMQG